VFRLGLPTSIRLGCKGLPETNTLAYSEYSLFTDVKRLITLGPGVNVINTFRLRHLLRGLARVFVLVKPDLIFVGKVRSLS
jgi:hypothetical protein